MEDFLCCNAISIVEAKYYSEMHPNAIYNNDDLIGFSCISVQITQMKLLKSFMFLSGSASPGKLKMMNTTMRWNYNEADMEIIMKKIIAFTLCLALNSFALTGCSGESEPFKEKRYTPDKQVSGINLEVRDREIEVSLSEDEQIHIQYFENDKEYYDISVSDENVLTMVNTSSKEWTDYIGGKSSAENRKILLQIPDTLLDNLSLSTTNENVSLPALAVTGNITISCNSGNITFESLNVGNALSLTVKNGDISGKVIGNYDDFAIQTEIKNGEINLPDTKDSGEKLLNVSSNNGDVDIAFVK